MRVTAALLLLFAVSLFAQTEDRIKRSIPVQGSGRLTLNAEMGSIQVQPGSASSINVEVAFRGNAPSREEFNRMFRDFILDVNQQGADVLVAGRFDRGWVERRSSWFSFRNWNHCRNGRCLEYTWLKDIEYRVSVPAGFNTELNTSGGSISVGDLKAEVRARTSGGALSFGRIDGPVDGRTSGGSITLRGGKGRAVLHTSGGSIRIEEVSGDVDAETSGGSIAIARTTGRVRAATSGGSVSVRETSGPVDASTSGGGIDVALTSNQGYEIDASTSGGGVSSEFPGLTGSEPHPQQLRGPVNGGGSLVRLRTSGGGIRIRRAS